MSNSAYWLIKIVLKKQNDKKLCEIIQTSQLNCLYIHTLIYKASTFKAKEKRETVSNIFSIVVALLLINDNKQWPFTRQSFKSIIHRTGWEKHTIALACASAKHIKKHTCGISYM